MYLGEHRLFDPLEHPGPVLLAEEYDGEVPNLSRLYERERLEEFVERAVAAGEDDEGVAVLDEHGLAHEEVFEGQRARLVRVRLLLEGEFDVAADGDAARLERAAVRETRRGLLRARVVGVCGGRARGAEDRDAARDGSEFVEPFDELAHDSE